jgi:hypothetical protein
MVFNESSPLHYLASIKQRRLASIYMSSSFRSFNLFNVYCESSMVLKREGMVPHHARIGLGVRVMVFNATFNNILVISLRSFLLVKETGENHQPAVSH